MRVLIRGVGNIGTTLANLILAERKLLGVHRVIVHKGAPQPFLEADLDLLRDQGAEIVTGKDVSRLLSEVDFIFDCRAAGMPRLARDEYEALPRRVQGVVAQGTEEGFGIPFATGVNDVAVAGERFVQVVSCNAHAAVTLLRTLGGDRLAELREADFVVVRRCEDLGGHDRLIAGTVVARHRDDAGTHHATAARRLYETLGLHPHVTSSDVTTPSQLMHTVRFFFRLASDAREEEVRARIDQEPFLSTTKKFDANRIFELGRRYGFQGRIYAHAIVVANDLHVRRHEHGLDVRGWAFVPQEGNTILSTLDAFLLQVSHPDRGAILERLRRVLMRKVW